MPSYDKAITIFAPDGKLFQVEYAFEAVNKGTATIGIKGKDSVILAVEKPAISNLQDAQSIKKIVKIDNHIMCTFAGLQADARVVVDKARLESQAFRFNLEDTPTVEYVAKSIAETKQKYTQKGGVRPFGVSCFFAGFQNGLPKLYQTEPSGAFNEWKANAIGRNASTLREFLEKKWEADLDDEKTIRLTVETLMEVVEQHTNMQVCVIKNDKITMVEDDVLEALVAAIKKEKDDAEEAKKNKKK